jgi:glutathione peroxidase
MADIYSFDAQTIDGRTVSLGDWRGKVLLIVNTASKCGFTPQYDGLEKLQQTYGPRGFAVLGFPCNQFGGQEPGTEADIDSFCRTSFGVDFPMFAKVDVNGTGTHPLYAALKHAAPGLLGSEAIKWNFTKFLIDRDGNAIERFAPATKPEALAKPIEALL